MCHCFSARSDTRPTAVVRREFLVSVRYGGASNTEAGSCKPTTLLAASLHTCVKDSRNPESRAVVEISTKRGKLDVQFCTPTEKLPAILTARLTAPCFGFVDGSPPRNVPSTA